MWWNWQTRDAQNVVPQGMGVRLSPWSLMEHAPMVKKTSIVHVVSVV